MNKIPIIIECDLGNGHEESEMTAFNLIEKKVIIRDLQGNVIQVLENCTVQELQKFVCF